MPDFSPLDGAAVAILLVTVLRGFFIGLIREGFSIAALGGACLMVMTFKDPAATWLQEVTRGEIGPGAAPWIAGAALLITTVLVVGMVGRWLKRGAQAAGLGWADRLGGSALGAAEGALVIALIVTGASWIVGRDHPAIAESRTIVAYEAAQRTAQSYGAELPQVAAPPPPQR